MEYTTLGHSEVEVSRVGLGLWNISGGTDWEKTDERDAIETIHAAIDEGITFLDTAESYGDGYSERVLGQALENVNRDDVVVATKVSAENLTYEGIKAACRDSLDRLNTDYVDVYYVHYQNPEIPITDTASALRELKDDGLIRVPAVSNTGTEDLSQTLDHVRVEGNQVPYSLLWRAIEYDVQAACIENDVDVVAYSPLAQGLLTGTYGSVEEYPTGRMRTRHFSGDRPHARHGEQGAEKETFDAVNEILDICAAYDRDVVDVAIAWVLRQDGVASALVGASSEDHVRANARAVDVELSEDLVADLESATMDLKTALGPNPDPWQSDSRYR